MCVTGELRTPEAYIAGELRAAEVCVAGELRAAEAYVAGELRLPEASVFEELRVLEVSVSGELRTPEVCAFGEFRVPEVCVSDELRIHKICFTVEAGGCKIALFNVEVVQGVENGRSAEIKIKVTPGAWNGFDYLAFLFDSAATALAHFNEDSAAYILFFAKCRLIFGEISFIVIRL